MLNNYFYGQFRKYNVAKAGLTELPFLLFPSPTILAMAKGYVT
jgi:hypothetical protein